MTGRESDDPSEWREDESLKHRLITEASETGVSCLEGRFLADPMPDGSVVLYRAIEVHSEGEIEDLGLTEEEQERIDDIRAMLTEE